ncbi:hypothetical protein N7452_008700 [Penicillium brevicompactum]|uniref:Uncharacterized protein n=1 Tax=Penicillium brevicompactum TaxID=5074 RepID=A0A9W9UBJ5_PENBR|nr:hypothetical protein N7452_008700 [Penicillium brevicompactum]
MGHKVSVVRGVKSDHFYNQQNGINEIWVGDVEVISRLPFGDSDQEQSSWPPGEFQRYRGITSSFHSTKETISAIWLPKIRRANTLPAPVISRFLQLDMPAYILGCILSWLIFWGVYNTLSSAKEIPNDKEQLLMSEPSVIGGWLGLDVDIMLSKLRRLCSRSALSLALSIFFFFMGLPAFAAGSENAVAVAFIISKGVGVSVGYIGIYVVLLLFMVGRPWGGALSVDKDAGTDTVSVTVLEA